MTKMVYGIGDLGAAFLPPPPAPPPPIDPATYFKNFGGRSLAPTPVHTIAIQPAAPAPSPGHTVIPLPGMPIFAPGVPVGLPGVPPSSPAAPVRVRAPVFASPLPLGDVSPIDRGVIVTGAAIVAGLGLAIYFIRRRS